MTIIEIKQFIEKHGLVFMVFAALVIGAILVGIGMSLYVTSGASKLDLSRPGFEQVREDVVVKDEEDAPYSASGPLDQEAVDDFRTRFSKQREEMNRLGNFGSDVLSDASLGLD